MDPLSITLSIITLLQLTQQLTTYAISVRHASEEQKKVAQEASNLCSLLTALDLRVKEAKVSDPWFTQVQLLAGKNGPLEQLRELLEQLVKKTSIKSTSKTIDHSISRLTWQFTKKDVEDLLIRIERIKTLINLALLNDLSALTHAINDNITQLTEKAEEMRLGIQLIQQSISDERKNDLSYWLGVPDPSVNYRAALQKRQANTGIWLTKASSFNSWKSSTSSSAIWLYGKAGCGKTVLSSTALEDILETTSSSPDSYTSYFYFDFNDREKQLWRKAIRSLVFQFSLQQPESLQALEALYKSCHDGKQQPAEDTISTLLQDCVKISGNKYILLDALDECADREPFLEFLQHLTQRKWPGLHILMTSRYERDIQDHLYSVVNHKIDIQSAVVKEDIHTYVQGQLSSDRRLSKWPPLVKNKIQQVLMEKADGMFRWVYCQLESLRGCIRLSTLEKALLSLPKTLDDTYERIITQIRSSGELDCAIWILQWLCFSDRPLLLSEVNEVLALHLGDEMEFRPEERLPDPFDVISICLSLVSYVKFKDDNETDDIYRIKSGTDHKSDEDTAKSKLKTFNSGEDESHHDGIENESDIPEEPSLVQVRLAHYSVKEYLLSERSPLKSHFQSDSARDLIAQGCLGYLSHMGKSAPLTHEKIAEHPLALYAAAQLPKHMMEIQAKFSDKLMKACLRLALDEEGDMKLCHQLDVVRKRQNSPYQYHIEGFWFPPSLHVLSELGLVDVVSELINSGVDVATRSPDKTTALHTASEHGRESVVKLLLEKGIDTEMRNGLDETALHTAVISYRNNRQIILELLNGGADIEARARNGKTALHRAAWYGHEKVVQVLLEKGADCNARDELGCTPLWWASRMDNLESVKLLIANGADINAKSDDGETPLRAALMSDSEEIAKLLRDHGGVDEVVYKRFSLI